MHPPQIHCKSLTCMSPRPSVMSWPMLMSMSLSLAIWPRGDGNGPRDSTQAAGPSETSRMLARCTGYRSGTQSSRLADREKKHGDQGHLPRQRSHCHQFRPRTARRPRVRASSPPYLDRDDDRDIRRTKPSCWRSEATGDLLVANIGGLPSALRDQRPGGRLPRDREAS